MGQYWIPVNLDKREYILPHTLGAGLKLWEQLASFPATGAGLLVLAAAQPEARGAGDLDLDGPDRQYAEIARRTIGRWAGDRIALVGDYAEAADLPEADRANLIYGLCDDVDDVRHRAEHYEKLANEDGQRPAEREKLLADAKALREASPFVDVSRDVSVVIEHELGGRFSGSGWRDFETARGPLPSEGEPHVWFPVSLDAREFVDPRRLCGAPTLRGQMEAHPAAGQALLILAAAEREPRGGGDFDLDANWHGPERRIPPHNASPGPMPRPYPAVAHATIGRWAGHRVALVGVLAKASDLPAADRADLIPSLCRPGAGTAANPADAPFADVTDGVRAVIEHELQGRFRGKTAPKFVPVRERR